jgi:hypothetical protein
MRDAAWIFASLLVCELASFAVLLTLAVVLLR